jgi:stress-induced morphogen
MRGLQLVRSLSSAAKSMSTQAPVEAAIRTKLAAAFDPVHFDVVNESYKHNVPKGAESHFVVVVVSDAFDGKSPIQRHRMVNQVLEEELKNSVHALSIQAKTPSQWAENPVLNKTPNCLGGDK